jgi:hypothetical protein
MVYLGVQSLEHQTKFKVNFFSILCFSFSKHFSVVCLPLSYNILFLFKKLVVFVGFL